MKTHDSLTSSFLSTLRRKAGIATALLLAAGSLPAQITARGSDSTLHVMKALAEAYQKETSKTVKLEGGGSGAGAKALVAGEVSLAFLSRALKDSEKQSGLIGQTYAIDGVTVVVNKQNPIEDLSLEDLKNLFTGKTAAWPDGKPVVLFNRNADSGTREVFQELVLGKEVFSDKAAVKHDALLISSVAKIPTSACYVSAGEVDEAQVKVVTINKVKSTTETLRGGSYPISRTPTLATKGEAKGEEKAFIDFVLSEKGQAIVKEQKLVPVK